MDSNNKKHFERKVYEPYFKEVSHCFYNDIFLASVLLVLVIVISILISDYYFLILYTKVFVIFLIIEYLFIYHIFFKIIFERRKYDWCNQKVTIIKIVNEYSFSGNRLQGPIIPRLYPAKARVNRYKLICQNEDGKIIRLRSVMSAKKCFVIENRLSKSLSTNCTIYYGKHSKIVMFYKGEEKWTDLLNHIFY